MANLSHANIQYSPALEPQPNFKRLTNTLAYMALENIYVGPYLGFANTDKTTEQVEYTALEK